MNYVWFRLCSAAAACVLGVTGMTAAVMATDSVAEDALVHIHEYGEETLVRYDGQYVFEKSCGGCGDTEEVKYDSVITFVDDDGKADALMHWERIVDSTGIRMNSALITGFIPETTDRTSYASYAGWDTIDRLKDKGIEFVCHTDGHKNITTLTEEELHADFARAKEVLAAHGLNNEILVYPFLGYDNASISVVSQYFKMGVGGLKITNRIPADPYRISRITINDTSVREDHDFDGKTVSCYTIKTLEKLKADVHSAIEEQSWLVFKSHAYNSPGAYYWFDEEDEQTIIDLCEYIKQLPNVKIITLSEALPLLDTEQENVQLMSPVIMRQPQSISVKQSGDAAKVSVVADGEDLQYQWYIKNPGSSKFYKSSTKASAYSIRLNESNNGRQVYCRITDAYGNTVQTNTVTLRIKQELQLTGQLSDVSVEAAGDVAALKAQAVGDGLTYQRYVKNAGSSKFYKSSITTSKYSVRMNESNSGRKVYCRITDTYGNTVQTNTVTLRIKQELQLTGQLSDVSVEAAGDVAALKAQAVGDGLTYQWYVKNAGSSKFVKSSITTSTYSVRMNESNNGRSVYCCITDAYGSTVMTNIAVLRIQD